MELARPKTLARSTNSDLTMRCRTDVVSIMLPHIY
jgi:hypothetical protein